MSNKRERSVNFTREENDLLINLVSEFRNIIENKKSDAVTWMEKERCWKLIEDAFNSQSGVTFRSSKTLKHKYEGIKRTTRKKAAAVRAETYRTGGGCSDAPILTPTEEKVKQMILISVDGMCSVFDSDNLESPDLDIGDYSKDPIKTETLELEHKDLNPAVTVINESFEASVPTVQGKKALLQLNEELSDPLNLPESYVSNKKTHDLSNKSCNVLESIEIEEPEGSDQNNNESKTDTNSKKLVKKWTQWKPKDLKSRKHPALCQPKAKKPFEKVAESKLELAEIQKMILQEELKSLREKNKFDEEERVHKQQLWVLEKQLLLNKIEKAKKEYIVI